MQLSISPLLIPAVALSTLTVGYGLALAIPDPSVTNLVTNALVFFVLLFSPIVYPASHLPDWLQDVHHVLPLASMATVVRAGLTDLVDANVGSSFLVLGAWAIAGCLLTAWVVRHRR